VSTSRREPSRLLPLLVALAALLPYLQLPAMPLVYDAPAAVSRNEAVQQGSPWHVFAVDFWGAPLDAEHSTRSYRPLVSLTWALGARAGLDSPAALHVVDMALHAFASLLVLALGRLLGLGRRWSAAAGALFALHPLATEAVASVVGRADLLAAVLFFLALLLHLRGGVVRNFAAVACIAASLLCKEYAVAFPFVLVGIDLVSEGSSRGAIVRHRRFWIALLVVLTGYLALRVALTGALGGVPMLAASDHPLLGAPFSTRAAMAARLLLLACQLLVLPVGLNHHYRARTLPIVDSFGDPLAAGGAALAIVTLAIAVFVSSRQRRPLPLAAWLLVFLPLLPGLNLLSIGGVVFAERYLYVPLAGFALFAAWLLERVAVRLPLLRPVVVGALALALVACFVLAADRVGDWSSDERLARSSLEVYPGGSEVWRDLGLAVGREGRHAEALAAFERAVELEPRAPQTWKAYATALVNLGQYEEGARAWRECIERTPGETPPALWRGLGEALLYGARAQVDAGDPAEALRLVGEIEALGHADGEILGAAKEVREVAERLP
jgi:hypothetical protein